MPILLTFFAALSFSGSTLSFDAKPIETVLAPGGSDEFALHLSAGQFAHITALQEGVDVEVKVVGPDGVDLATVDSPNGTLGPETVDVTAKVNGDYKIVVRSMDPKAKAGKYAISVTSAKRYAFENVEASLTSPTLIQLCKDVEADPAAAEAFAHARKGKGPLVETVEGDRDHDNLSFLYMGTSTTRLVQLVGGPTTDGPIQLTQIPMTNLWAVTILTPRDSRFIYSFAVDNAIPLEPGRSENTSIDRKIVPDSLNDTLFNGRSMLVLKDAPLRPYADNPAPKAGKLEPYQIKSKVLKEARGYSVYTPPGFDPKRTGGYGVVVVFDGEAYGIGFNGLPALIPTPNILDNLADSGKTPPLMAILVRSQSTRTRDLPCSDQFMDFLVHELLPEVRGKYPAMTLNPKRVIAAGSSFGGLCSAYCALTHPEAFGNVLSQSGSYWVSQNDWQSRSRDLEPGEGLIQKGFIKAPHLPVRFFMEVGTYESSGNQLMSNRQLRDILKLKGYDLNYNEFHGNHDYQHWRGSLAIGLMDLTRDWPKG